MNRELVLLARFESLDEAVRATKLSQREKEYYTNLFIKKAKEFLKEHFNITELVPIKINGRLTRVSGRFRHKTLKLKDMPSKVVPFDIELSERDIALSRLDIDEEHALSNILDVLYHELVHYALAYQGYSRQEFSDGHPIFERKLSELGISSSGATSASKRISNQSSSYYKIYDVHIATNGKEVLVKHRRKTKYVNRVAFEVYRLDID